MNTISHVAFCHNMAALLHFTQVHSSHLYCLAVVLANFFDKPLMGPGMNYITDTTLTVS